MDDLRVPSGKLSHNYGKSSFSTGKSTLNGPFSMSQTVKLPEGSPIDGNHEFLR